MLLHVWRGPTQRAYFSEAPRRAHSWLLSSWTENVSQLTSLSTTMMLSPLPNLELVVLCAISAACQDTPKCFPASGPALSSSYDGFQPPSHDRKTVPRGEVAMHTNNECAGHTACPWQLHEGSVQERPWAHLRCQTTRGCSSGAVVSHCILSTTRVAVHAMQPRSCWGPLLNTHTATEL